MGFGVQLAGSEAQPAAWREGGGGGCFEWCFTPVSAPAACTDPLRAPGRLFPRHRQGLGGVLDWEPQRTLNASCFLSSHHPNSSPGPVPSLAKGHR